jgi:hypothetical protein
VCCAARRHRGIPWCYSTSSYHQRIHTASAAQRGRLHYRPTPTAFNYQVFNNKHHHIRCADISGVKVTCTVIRYIRIYFFATSTFEYCTVIQTLMELMDRRVLHTHTTRWHSGTAWPRASVCVSAGRRSWRCNVRVGKGMVGRVFFFNARLAPRLLAHSPPLSGVFFRLYLS